MPSTMVHECEHTELIGDLKKAVFGNGRIGLVESHAKLSGYLKGCAAVGTIVLAIILLLVGQIMSSINSLEQALRTKGEISHSHSYAVHQQSNPELSSDTSIR